MPFTKPDVNTVWASTGTSVAPTVSKIEQGWVSEIPTYENFNFILNRQDEFNAHVNQYGVAVWDGTTAYIAGKSYVQGSDGNIYKALTSNTNSDPTTAGSVDWVRAFNNYDYSYSKAATDGKYLQISKNLSDVNAPTARANLGIAFANDSVAKAGTDTTQYINAHGVAAFVAQFGLGVAFSGSDATTDWNDVGTTKSTFAGSLLGSGNANAPKSSGYWYPETKVLQSGSVTQFAWGYRTSDGNYWRTRYTGTWTPWVRFWDDGNFNPASKLDATAKAVDSNKLNGQLASYYWNQGNFNPALYAPLASPNFSGNPLAPTQSTSDSSTKIASTAFVKNVAAGYLPLHSKADTAGTADNANALGGTTASNYALQSWVSSNYLGLHAKADSAGTADSATNANYATNAGTASNSNQLQGNAASAFANTGLSNVSDGTVVGKLAGMSAGGIGALAFLRRNGSATINPGSTYAGNLYYADANSNPGGGAGGTWMALGYAPAQSSYEYATLFIRVA